MVTVKNTCFALEICNDQEEDEGKKNIEFRQN